MFQGNFWKDFGKEIYWNIESHRNKVTYFILKTKY